MENEQQLDYEKISYGKIGYRRIQRLRKKGKRRGIEVPPLGFELTKPEKPRIAFWVAAIVGIVLFVGILVATGFLGKFLIDVFSDYFKETGGLFKTLLDPKTLFVTQGLSFVPVMLLILGYLFVALLVIVPLMIAVYCYRFARNMLYMARCSKEEFAKGELVTGSIINDIGILVGATVLLIVILSLIEAHTAKLLVGLIYGGIVVIFGGLLALTAVEKRRCGQWFAELDEEKQQNYLAHEKALRSVKSRLNLDKYFWDRLFK